MRPATLTPMRRAIGRRMSASKQQAPHFYVSAELVLDPALAHVEELKRAAPQARVSLTAVLVRASVVALKAHPALNAVWAGEELMLAQEANVGVAIALDDGLIAPAIFERDATDVVCTARALDDLVARARSGRLRGAEATGATFTLSNLGMFAVTSFIAIVTPPQVAILGAGTVTRAPRFVDGGLVERALMTVTVSADHRAVDGADVARFLQTFKTTIEELEGVDG
ncbi:MAG: hypothetical protein V7607_117 [Solirubrobacteraceae bacterium]